MKAMRADINSIEKKKTRSLMGLPKEVKPIGKRVFKVKRNPGESINKHKAKLVVKGCVQQPGIDYDKMFAPEARIEKIRFLVALAWIKFKEMQALLKLEDLPCTTQKFRGDCWELPSRLMAMRGATWDTRNGYLGVQVIGYLWIVILWNNLF